MLLPSFWPKEEFIRAGKCLNRCFQRIFLFFFLHKNATRERMKVKKLIFSFCTHFSLLVITQPFKKEVNKEEGECFWDLLQTLMTDDSFSFIHSRMFWRWCAEIVKIGKPCWSNLMSWTDRDQKQGRSLVQIYSLQHKDVGIFSGSHWWQL